MRRTDSCSGRTWDSPGFSATVTGPTPPAWRSRSSSLTCLMTRSRPSGCARAVTRDENGSRGNDVRRHVSVPVLLPVRLSMEVPVQPAKLLKNGASGQDRTDDLSITNRWPAKAIWSIPSGLNHRFDPETRSRLSPLDLLCFVPDFEASPEGSPYSTPYTPGDPSCSLRASFASACRSCVGLRCV